MVPREWQEGMCEGAGKMVVGGRQKVGEGDFRPPVRISRILYHRRPRKGSEHWSLRCSYSLGQRVGL